MKRLSSLILFIAAGFAFSTVSARQVDITTAREVAAYYFSAATGAKAPIADELELALQVDNTTLCLPAIYVFNIPGGGWVMTSATDNVEPILAYSPDGKIDADNMGANFEFLLGRYQQMVSLNQSNSLATSAEVRQKWQELEEQTLVGQPDKSPVLIQTKWGQGDADEPTYNCMCPMDGNKRSITGCVAVAVAQIIKYWDYPVQGGTSGNMKASTMWNGERLFYDFAQDSNKFDYERMPKKLKYTDSAEVKRAVGKLFYAVGVVCKMDWSSSSSSASSNNAFLGYTKYFNYDNECRYESFDNLGQESWITLLRNETRDNARPVYISGRTVPDEEGESSGHAFIACGVSGNDSNKIYLNLGWDGSENGFYTMNPIADMQQTSAWVFNQDLAMIHHLHPKGTEGIEETSILTTVPVYPNPASEYVMIPSGLSLCATLAIYSLDGKLVDKAAIPAGAKEYRLDISSYPAGTYIYRLNGETGRFVKE